MSMRMKLLNHYTKYCICKKSNSFVWQKGYTLLSICNPIDMTLAKLGKDYENHFQKKSLSSSIPHGILHSNGKLTRNHKEITSQFIQFFATIGLKLSNDVPRNLSHHFFSYLQNPVFSSMFLAPATRYEIDTRIQNLKLKKMHDEEDIPPFFLELAKNILSFPELL